MEFNIDKYCGSAMVDGLYPCLAPPGKPRKGPLLTAIFVVMILMLFNAGSAGSIWLDLRVKTNANAARLDHLAQLLEQAEDDMLDTCLSSHSRPLAGPRRLVRKVKIRTYAPTPEQCGDIGLTSSGLEPRPGVHVALSPDLKALVPFGSKVHIPNLGWREVQDTTARRMRNTVDVMVAVGEKNFRDELEVEFVIVE